MRGFAVGAVAVATFAIAAVSAVASKPGQVTCPLKVGAPSGGDVQWGFSDTGRPAGSAVRSSYVHGRGSWTNGHATGIACTMNSPTQGGAARDLVLAVTGRSKLIGRIRQNGLLGVRMVLGIKVHVSDDPACAQGTAGRITLFASYYSVHRDTMRVQLGARCAASDLSYSGSALHVYIARHGAQVNSP